MNINVHLLHLKRFLASGRSKLGAPRALISFAAIAVGLFSPSYVVAAEPKVLTIEGVVQGVHEAGLDVFKGIPFAAPPIGSLRWRAPQPVAPWKGVRRAEGFSADCMQAPSPFPQTAGAHFDEDCLYLNVWKTAGKVQKRPVLVWIYGGGFIGGGSSSPISDGGAFARQGVVFVSLNYRLGRLGFFAHPALSAANEGPLGNYGYMDQIAALRWVKRNIASFGGDPDQITVMGESAGGISVADLIVSPAAKGLFNRAIIMSGGGRAAMANRPLKDDGGPIPSAEQIGMNFAKSQGISGAGEDTLARLRALPSKTFVADFEGQALKINGELKSGLTHVGGPIIDGYTKFGIVDQQILKLGGLPMPVMVGTTSADLGVPTGQDKEALFGDFKGYAVAARRAYDPDGAKDEHVVREEVTRDRLLTEPARFVARQAARMGHNAYYYRFGYLPEALRSKLKGVFHGGDNGFFFGNPKAQFGPMITPEDEAAATMMNAYLANFVLHGDPNGSALPRWKSMGEDADGVMQIGPDLKAQTITDPLRQRLDLVDATAGVPLIENTDPKGP